MKTVRLATVLGDDEDYDKIFYFRKLGQIFLNMY